MQGRLVALALAGMLAVSFGAGGLGAQTQPETVGRVTLMPLPRYVSLKTSEGRARRGPGLTHRVDWIFTRRNMPLRMTNEFENWRQVEDSEGQGGWIHASLLSGVRTVLVTAEATPMRARPQPGAPVTAILERGVVAGIVECAPDWCRLNAEGTRGWVERSAIWGLDPNETLD